MIDIDLSLALAALSVVAGLTFAGVVMTWPAVPRRQFAAKVRQLSIDPAAAAISPATGSASLAKARPIFQRLYKALHLEAQSGDGDMRSKLRMAGFRGRGPMIVFLVARSLAPVAAAAVAALYIFVLLELPYPLSVTVTMVIAAALAGYYTPSLYLQNRILKRQTSIRDAWPDALDLLLICIGAGMSIELALRKVAAEIGGQSRELGEELDLITAELAYIPDRGQVYETLAHRTGLDEIRAAATALAQADQYGTSLGDTVRVLAQESRDGRMADAERRANALPPKLTVPMIVFFLPVLLAVVITPAAIQIVGLL